MDSIGVQVGVLLAVLLLVERLIAARRHDGTSGAATFFTWLVLTSVALWCGGLAAFVVVHGLLFTLGQAAATVGAIAAGVALVAIPFLVAVGVRRSGRPPRGVSPRG